MKLFKKNNILLIYFLYLIVGIIIYSILQANEFPQKYVFTEWLINYEGGFVRRGLLGEIVFKISKIRQRYPCLADKPKKGFSGSHFRRQKTL